MRSSGKGKGTDKVKYFISNNILFILEKHKRANRIVSLRLVAPRAAMELASSGTDEGMS